MADDEGKKRMPPPPQSGVKPLLTHDSARRKPKADKQDGKTPTPRDAGSASAARAGKVSRTDRIPAGSPERSPAALSEKMAAISSIRDSKREDTTSSRSREGGRHRPGSDSGLPETLSRMDRHQRAREMRNRVSKAEKEAAQSEAAESLSVEDPQPGALRVAGWFLFRFGRFVQGPMLRQSALSTVGLLIVSSLAMTSNLMEWTMGSLAVSESVYVAGGFFLRLGIGALGALGGLLLIGLSLWFGLKQRESGVGPLFALRMVVNAFLPLAVAQFLYLVAGSAWMGEAFWRGSPPPTGDFWIEWVVPCCWGWSGFRLAQAMCAVGSFSFFQRVLLRIASAALAGIVAWALHPETAGRIRAGAVEEWTELRHAMLKPGSAFDAATFSRIERRLPLRAVRTRQELILFRLQQLFRQGDMEGAKEEASHLDRLSPDGSAMDDLAKGLNFFLRDRPDLAVARWEAALAEDPDCLPAHQWMALASVGVDVDRAESHARILMKADPNVFHLYLLVRILEARGNDAAIWEAMFDVDAPPEDWYPLTLLQGGEAARALGKERRAERLLTLARARGMRVEEEEPAADSAGERDGESDREGA